MLQTNTDLHPPASNTPRVSAARRWLWPHKWWLAGLAALAAALALVLARWLVGPEVVVYRVIRGDLVRTVVASGHVETPYRVNIGTQFTGTVDEVLVDEGQTVKRGQPLVVLESSELKSAVVEALGALAQAEARVRQLREFTLPSAQQALKQAQATLVNAEADFQRAEQLSKAGFGTREALDAAIRDLDVARTQVRTAELTVYSAQPGGSDYVLAVSQLNQAKANVATAQARLAYATITAPRDGTLITRNVERGAIVQPGNALFVLAPAGDVQLVLQIDEKNLGLLRPGQNALASADAYPDQRFDAILSYINPSVDIARASVQVKLTAKAPPAYLRQDMTVSVDIEIDKRTAALIVPARAVHDPTSASPWVLVVRDGRPREQPVRLGLRTSEQVEVLDGLAQDDLVVPVAAGVRAGQRIRPVVS
jgi:HlyD family secretion protein